MMKLMAKLIEENAGHNKHDSRIVMEGGRNRESKREEEWNCEIKLMMDEGRNRT